MAGFFGRIVEAGICTGYLLHYNRFCPLRDLHDLMNKHYTRARGIPEQFLWYLFECLCIAGLVLEHGESEKAPVANWTPIVHRDMKMGNVFLGLPSETHYRCYPVPKLGDFGLAITLPDGRLTDDDDLDTFGTDANMPIEQIRSLMSQMDDGKLSWPLTSKANVWGVANIVASLVIQQEGFQEFYDFKERREPFFNATQENRYSQELRDLITDCMRFDPNRRPDLTRVLANIRTHRLASLPTAPPTSLAWNGNTIAQEILDLVCALRR
jgi:serine/threonine protein kinase